MWSISGRPTAAPRVGVLRVAQHVLGGAGLDDAAEVHHRDPVGDVPRQAEVVGDDQHAEAEVAAQGEQQRQDLAPDGGVERGDRLVGDQQLGRHRQRAGDQHPLPLPARQLVRVAQEQPLGRPEPGRRQRGGDQLGLGATLARRSLRRRGGAGGCPRRRTRRPCAAGSAPRPGPGAPAGPCAGTPSSPRADRSSGWPSSSTSPADGGSRPSRARAKRGLARPRLPHQRHDLARGDAQVDAVDALARRDRPGPGTRTDRPRGLEAAVAMALIGASTSRQAAARVPSPRSSGTTRSQSSNRLRAAGVERAARRQLGRVGRVARQTGRRVARLGVADPRERRGQRVRRRGAAGR